MKKGFFVALVALLLFTLAGLKAFSQTPVTLIYRFSPDSATTGQTVTLIGESLTGATAVSFGGVAVQSFRVVNDSVITAVVGSGASGQVAVQAPAGSAAKAGFTYVAPGTSFRVNSISPLIISAGTLVTITGSALHNVNYISLPGTTGTTYVHQSDSEIVITVGDLPGAGVLMGTVASRFDTLVVQFTYTATPLQPIISSFSPDSAATGQSVRLIGQRFAGTTSVSFGGIAARTFTVFGDTLLTAVVDSGASGQIVVQTSAGTATKAGFTYLGSAHIPTFTVTDISPDSGMMGTVITIRGHNLANVSNVGLNGTQGSWFKALSDSVIQATVGEILTTGIDSIQGLIIGSPDTVFFWFKYAPPPPAHFSISSLSPDTGTVGTLVTIRGTGLDNVTNIHIPVLSDGVYIMSRSDTAIVISLGYSPGPASLTVTITGELDTFRTSFYYLAPPKQPRIYSFSPTSATTGDTVLIFGANLIGLADVFFGNTPASKFTILTDSLMAAVVGSGSSGAVRVDIPLGLFDSLPGFTFIPLPDSTAIQTHISYFSPFNGTTGTAVTIVGSNLNKVSAINFGGVPASSFSIVSDTSVTAVVGTGASGFVTVTTPSSADSLAGFTFFEPMDSPAKPVKLSYFSPRSGTTGSTVTIVGSNLQHVSLVSFGGVPASSFAHVSDTSITAVVGMGASGDVRVSTDSSGEDSLAGFAYIAAQDTVSPYRLIGFGGTYTSGMALLGWSASGEQGIANYSIESSSDSIHFLPVATVISQGKPGPDNYTYYDSSLADVQTMYYKLEAIDTAGRTVVISIISIGLVSPISVYPNPAAGTGFITVQYPYSISNSVIRIVDANGRVMLTVELAAGTTQTVIPLLNLQMGVYQLRWMDWKSGFTKTILVH